MKTQGGQPLTRREASDETDLVDILILDFQASEMSRNKLQLLKVPRSLLRQINAHSKAVTVKPSSVARAPNMKEDSEWVDDKLG